MTAFRIPPPCVGFSIVHAELTVGIASADNRWLQPPHSRIAPTPRVALRIPCGFSGASTNDRQERIENETWLDGEKRLSHGLCTYFALYNGRAHGIHRADILCLSSVGCRCLPASHCSRKRPASAQGRLRSMITSAVFWSSVLSSRPSKRLAEF
jgi:hypothetical protein